MNSNNNNNNNNKSTTTTNCNVKLDTNNRGILKDMLEHLANGKTKRYKDFKHLEESTQLSSTTLYNICNLPESRTHIRFKTLDNIENAYNHSKGYGLKPEVTEELDFAVSEEQALVDDMRAKLLEINAIDDKLKLLRVTTFINRDYVNGEGGFTLDAEKATTITEIL